MKRFSFLTLVSLAAIMLLSVGSVQAETFTVNFNDAPAGELTDGYGGLNWENIHVYDKAEASPGSGYAMINEQKGAFSAWAEPSTIIDLNRYLDFDAFTAVAAWQDDLNINIKGYTDNSLKFEKTFLADHDVLADYFPGFKNINQLRISTSDGTEVPGLTGSGAHPIFESLTFSDSTQNTVPEPTTCVLFIFGLLGIVGINRKKS